MDNIYSFYIAHRGPTVSIVHCLFWHASTWFRWLVYATFLATVQADTDDIEGSPKIRRRIKLYVRQDLDIFFTGEEIQDYWLHPKEKEI